MHHPGGQWLVGIVGLAIVIAGLVLPVIWRLRTKPLFLRRWVPIGSGAVALLGTYWLVQRVWF